MFCAKMPHYDESFIHDDNLNQRRNKRSYRVYKNGANPIILSESNSIRPCEVKSDLKLIRNRKNRGNRYKFEKSPVQEGNYIQYKSTDILIHYPSISVFDPSKLNDIKNNNIVTLTPCKSFDNLTLKQTKKDKLNETLRNGISLQNLSRDQSLKHYISPLEERFTPRQGDVRNSYSIEEARRRPAQRKYSRGPAPGVGVYRKINGDVENRSAKGLKMF